MFKAHKILSLAHIKYIKSDSFKNEITQRMKQQKLLEFKSPSESFHKWRMMFNILQRKWSLKSCAEFEIGQELELGLGLDSRIAKPKLKLHSKLHLI